MGDALGAPVEFMSRNDIVREFGVSGVRSFAPQDDEESKSIGWVTDDTQMTLFTAEGLLRAMTRRQSRGIGGGSSVLLAHAYVRWYATQTQPFPAEAMDGFLVQQPWLFSQRAPGRTVMAALAANADVEFPRYKLGADNNSKGCGSVMRSAPFGLLADWKAGAMDAMDASFITHGHRTASMSSAAFAAMIGLVVEGESIHGAVTGARSFINGPYGNRSAQETVAALDMAIALSHKADISSAEAVASIGEGWVAEEALAIAAYSALAYPREDQVLDALSCAVSHSGDSDSTGSICGNLLGAAYGVESLPRTLMDRLEGLETIQTVADDFYRVVHGGEDLMEADGYGVKEDWWRKYPGW